MRAKESKSFVFVGAGVVNLITALEICRSYKAKGEPIPKITFYEKNEAVGLGTSFAHSGNITPTEAYYNYGPVMAKSIETPFAKGGWNAVDNPTDAEKRWQDTVKKQAGVAQPQWDDAIIHLGHASMALWQELMDAYPELKAASDFYFDDSVRNGKGFPNIYTADVEPAIAQGKEALCKKAGIDYTVIALDDKSRNPKLTFLQENITSRKDAKGNTGHVLYTAGGAVNMTKLTQALQHLLQKEFDVAFHFGYEITQMDAPYIDNQPQYISSIKAKKVSKKGADEEAVTILGDEFFLSAGTGSKNLASVPIGSIAGITTTIPLPSEEELKKLGIRLPDVPLKYSNQKGRLAINVVNDDKGNPTHIRIGGALFAWVGNKEVNDDSKWDDFEKEGAAKESLAQTLEITKEIFPGLVEYLREKNPGMPDHTLFNAWLGLRPASPDLLPIVGMAVRGKHGSTIKNLHINAGHVGGGTSYAPGTAYILASIIHGDKKYRDRLPDAVEKLYECKDVFSPARESLKSAMMER